MAEQKYWLIKSEPETFSIDDLKKEKTTWWEGVRNYQARNFMMRDMKKGDRLLFYHSNTEPPGIAGLATVSKPARPDKTALDRRSKYFDPKATSENPRWYCVEVAFEKKWSRLLPLAELRKEKALKSMALLKPGMRLSIQPVSEKEYFHILKLAEM